MTRPIALPGCLVGSWRGVPFHVPDVATPAGRRIVAIDLPGTDITLHEDLGLATGPIRVSGLIAGDDHLATVQAFRAACEAPGPGTLVHPWLGEMQVVLSEPADIVFRSSELGTATFQATFERWSGASGLTGRATLAAIAAAVVGTSVVARALAGIAVARGGIDAAAALLATVATSLSGSLAGSSLSTLLSGTGLGASVSAIADGDGLADWAASLAAVVAGAGVPPASPAIGVGPLGRASEAAVDPWSTVVALLEVAVDAVSVEVDEGEGAARLSLAVTLLGAATDPLAAVDWESRQQALAARAAISTAIDTVARAAIAGGGADEDIAVRRETWRSLAGLRRAIHEDLDDRIGRLPSVMVVTPPTRVSAWVVAHHLFGDDPKAVREGFEDIVRRNHLAHPSILPDGPIEVLPQ
jgi:prophage DNA circulation protein